MIAALLGDVHGSLPALEAVLADGPLRGAEAVWDLGDAVGYGPFPDEVVARLRQVATVSVRGNDGRKVLELPERHAQVAPAQGGGSSLKRSPIDDTRAGAARPSGRLAGGTDPP